MKTTKKKNVISSSASVKKNGSRSTAKGSKKDSLPGYPVYPESEDIYSREKEEEDVNPENPSKRKSRNENTGRLNEKDFKSDEIGDDLDVPGAELDDTMENIGSEDEENNYYSLGGDDHDDLEEDKGD